MIIDSHSIVHSAILTILYCIIFMNLFPCVKFNCCLPLQRGDNEYGECNNYQTGHQDGAYTDMLAFLLNG